MAYLYQRIMDVPGLSGTAGQRQKDLYERLGAPMGGYTGSYDQNIWLLNQINQGNYGAAQAQPQAAAAGGGALIPGTNIPAPQEVTPFDQVLPFSKVFDPTLINQLAEQQIRPDVERAQYQASRGLEKQLAAGGGWRLGTAGGHRQNLADTYSRQLQEQTGAFTGQMKDWMQDWYNRQYESYYKNPARFKLPTLPKWDDFMKEKGMTNTPGGSTYQSPYKTSPTGSLYLPGAYS